MTDFDARRAAVAERLVSEKLDAALISHGPNLRYLTGFTGDNAALVLSAGRAVLFTDPRFEIQAAQEVTCEVKIAKGPLVIEVAKAIRRRRLRRVGFEPSRITCEAFDHLKTRLGGGVRLEKMPAWTEELRMVKSAAEIDLIRRSVGTNSNAFEQAVGRARVGIKEQDLAAELEYRMRRLGAEKPSFDTIIASGPRGALPHASPTAAEIRAGELVVVDMGAQQQGYCSDMTRMLYFGAPSAKVKRTYGAVLEAQLAAIDAVRPGVTVASVDRAARSTLEKHGLDKVFVHSTGHGLGLEIHEDPRIGRRGKGRLKTGMTITIEPGVYLEGLFGIRIEDTVLVTSSGCEVLTPTNKALRVL